MGDPPLTVFDLNDAFLWEKLQTGNLRPSMTYCYRSSGTKTAMLLT